MRVLTSKIYRAFPELDPYGDEQCVRFVRAARRGKVRRSLHMLLITLVAAATLAVGMLVVVLLGAYLDRVRGPGWDYHYKFLIPVVIVALVVISIAPIAAFVFRDWLLRRRIRYVLRARGVCAGCHYTLVGLPVGPGNMVACPECGFESGVDPSLGELVLDEAGRARFQPGPGSLPRPPRIFTPTRVRLLKRVGVAAAIAVLVGFPSVWFLYEMWLRHQAAVAAAERPGPSAVMKFVEDSQPVGVDAGAPDAWAFYYKAQAAVDTTDASIWRGSPPKTSAGNPVHPDFTLLLPGTREARTDEEREYNQLSEALARRLVEAYRAAGAYDEMRRMAACQRAVRPMRVGPGQSLVGVLLPELGKGRAMTRVNGARMALAAAAGDLTEYADALESSFAFARMCEHQPFAIDGLVGIAVEEFNYARLRELMLTHPDERWLDAIDSVIARQRPPVPPWHLIEGEHRIALDTTAWLFTDPDRVRRGRYSAGLNNLLGTEAEGRLGTYAENRDAVNDIYKALEARAKQEPWQRTGPAPDPETSDLQLVKMLTAGMPRAINSIDTVELHRRAHVLLAALERFRHRSGEYPERLDELVPAFIPAVPVDPWSGKPLGYVRVDPGADPQGRSYLLYSTGAGGVDDSGKVPPSSTARYETLHRAPPTGQPTYDFIINDAGN